MSSANTIHFNYTILNVLEEQKKSRLVAGLVLAVVVGLHITLALYLLNKSKPEDKKPVVVMEVALLSNPEPITKQAAKQTPPAPPVKKEPIKPKPVVKPPEPVKKPVVVKKTAPKPQPSEIKEIIPIPKFEPAATATPALVPPVVAPAAMAAPSESSNSHAPAKPAATAGRIDNDSKTVVSGVVPLVRVPPKYPARAANRHIEGWVKVEFTIQTDGSVDDAVVVSSEPEGIFDDAAVTAISKWEFKEKIVNGVAVPQRAVQTLQFKLEH